MVNEPFEPFLIRNVLYFTDGGTIKVYFVDALERTHMVWVPEHCLVLRNHSGDLIFDGEAVQRRSQLEGILLHGLREAQFDLEPPQRRFDWDTDEELLRLARLRLQLLLSWVESDEYLTWPEVRAVKIQEQAAEDKKEADRNIAKDAAEQAERDRELAARRRIANEQGRYQEGDRCLHCGWTYAWDGVACGHCKK